ncbi:MAG: flagellar motor protein MotB [Cellulosilyticaceae bacterium]
MKKSQDEPKKGAPAYMNTYGDMMTLLLCFFVLLFSMSTVDSAKFKAFIESFSGSTGILDGGEIILNDVGMLGNGMRQFPSEKNITDSSSEEVKNELKGVEEEIEAFIYEKKLDDLVGVEYKGDVVIMTFNDVLLFETGKAVLKPAAVPVLSQLGKQLKGYMNQGYQMKFEGHTDNVPIHTAQFPSNWELSAARAIAVARFFIDEMNFSPMGISAEGYGEYQPVGDNSTKQGKAQNRRVEIKLTKLVYKE